jgi:Clostripain family
MQKIFSLAVLCLMFFSAAAQAQSQPHAPNKWTFMVFMNGKNSLEDFISENLREMEAVGSNDQVNIIVQYATYTGQNASRAYILKSKNKKKITSPVLEDLGPVDMGSVKTLNDFIKWGVDNYPAEHYFITVWNHGHGWHDSGADQKRKRALRAALHTALPDISDDDRTGHNISTEELGQSMAYAKQLIGHNVDIYGSDACLMAMPEIANEMSDSVDYYVGSEANEPGPGWPYTQILKSWQKNNNAQPRDVAKILVKEFVDAYSGGSKGDDDVTFSAFDLSKLPAFDAALAKLSAELQQVDQNDKAKLLKAAEGSVRFDSDYLDLPDMLDRLQAQRMRGLSPDVMTNVKTAMKDLIIASGAHGYFAKAQGLSIWMPYDYLAFTERGRDLRYHELKFAKLTHWDDLLSAVVPRNSGGSQDGSKG